MVQYKDSVNVIHLRNKLNETHDNIIRCKKKGMIDQAAEDEGGKYWNTTGKGVNYELR